MSRASIIGISHSTPTTSCWRRAGRRNPVSTPARAPVSSMAARSSKAIPTSCPGMRRRPACRSSGKARRSCGPRRNCWPIGRTRGLARQRGGRACPVRWRARGAGPAAEVAARLLPAGGREQDCADVAHVRPRRNFRGKLRQARTRALRGSAANRRRDGGDAAGWQAAERAGGAFVRRWTKGAAPLPEGARIVILDATGRGHDRVGRGERELARSA